MCGRRFGKTTYAINVLVEEALLKNKSLFYYVAPTYRQAKQIAWTMLLESTRKLPKALLKKTNESELYVEIGNGSRIYIKGADDPDSLRGVGLDGCVLDEYADMKQNVFEDIVRPALTDKEGWCVFIGTPRGFNHFYELYVQASNLNNWSAYRFTTYDNPLIKPSEIEEARHAMSEDKFQQEYMAEFRKMEGLVYREFDRDKHVFKELPPRQYLETFAGLDFGFTNPFALIVIKKDYDNNYWIVAERYQTGKTTAEIIEIIKQLEINYIYPDPAEPDRIEEMKRAGLNIRDVDKGKSSIVAGIDKVRELLKTGRLKVHDSCVNTIWEFETYKLKEKKENQNDPEEALKENDHAMDALRYALMTNQPTRVVRLNLNTYQPRNPITGY